MILCFGDLHISNRGISYGRPEELNRALDFLSESINKFNPDLIVNLGDTLDSPYIKDTTTLLYWNKLLRILSGRSVVHLLGSHDPVSVDNKLSLVSNLSYIPGQKLVAREESDESVSFVSYLGDIKSYVGKGKRIVFNHFDLSAYAPAQEDRETLYVSGHLHLGGRFWSVVQAGSLLYNVGDYHTLDASSLDFSEHTYILPSVILIDPQSREIVREVRNDALLQFRVVLLKAIDVFGISKVLLKYKSNQIRLRVVNKCRDLSRESIDDVVKKSKHFNVVYMVSEDFEKAKTFQIENRVSSLEKKYEPMEELREIIKVGYADQLDVFEEVLRFGR